ncbi:hypothetical protein [Azospirillum sp. A39]|uniref:hypothetical protein n=1 Tax=Azospirillum sp. A39 TaxID=3462279 RepID=UPI0040460B08
MSADELERHIAAVSAALTGAHGEARAGAWIDLQGLDGRVEALCAAARALPPDEARRLLPGLEALVGALGVLAAELEEQRAATAAGPALGPHSARRRATSAYAGQPATPLPSDDP